MGTMCGARVLGRDGELGSLEAGKLADIALWRLDTLPHVDIFDPLAALVLGAPRRSSCCSSRAFRSSSAGGS